MNQQTKRRIIDYLETFLTESRRQRFDSVINQRMNHLTVVLENVFQSHNTSAVLRSADCFGIQNVHFIENKYAYHVNPEVDMGSSKWLTISRYRGQEFNTPPAYEALRKAGYRIVATTPHDTDCLLADLPIDQPMALIFGTEKEGLSEWAIQHADAWVKIPMYGFTESYNISVSAALILYDLTARIKNSAIPWQLNEEEKAEIRLGWIRNSIDQCELIEERFLKDHS